MGTVVNPLTHEPNGETSAESTLPGPSPRRRLVRRCMSRSQVREIREAQLGAQAARKQVRAYDLVKHVVGRLTGLRDLSSHGRHMDDFGG